MKVAKSRISKLRATARKTRTASYVDRREEILVAASAVIREKGLEAVSMRDIAQRLSAERAALYYYFASKHEIYVALIERASRLTTDGVEEIAASDEPALVRLRRAIEHIMRMSEEHYPYIFLYTQEDMRRLSDDAPRAKTLKEIGDRSIDALGKITRDGKRSGEFRTEVDPDMLKFAVQGAICWPHRWFVPGGRMTGAAIGASFADIFINGVAKRRR